MTEKRRGVPNSELQHAEFRKTEDGWQRRLWGEQWRTLHVAVDVRQRKNGAGRNGQQKVRTDEHRTWEWI